METVLQSVTATNYALKYHVNIANFLIICKCVVVKQLKWENNRVK